MPDDKDKIGIGSLRGDQIKSGLISVLQDFFNFKSKIIKINSAEKLNEEAQNYLLKILEEPLKILIIMLFKTLRLKKQF